MKRGNRWAHGHAGRAAQTREYQTWARMKQRCYDIKCDKYAYYGGRGVTVCKEWKNNFLQFLADMGPRPPGKSLDRINPEKGYSRDNCRWATRSEQLRNTRRARLVTIGGVTLHMKEWCEKTGTNYKLAWLRLKRGFSVEQAFGFEPIKR